MFLCGPLAFPFPLAPLERHTKPLPGPRHFADQSDIRLSSSIVLLESHSNNVNVLAGGTKERLNFIVFKDTCILKLCPLQFHIPIGARTIDRAVRRLEDWLSSPALCKTPSTFMHTHSRGVLFQAAVCPAPLSPRRRFQAG